MRSLSPLILALASPALAQSFTGLGTPAPGSSEAYALSGDGLTAVGCTVASAQVTGFRWTVQTGRITLPTAPGFTGSYALGASADGSAIAGYAYRTGGRVAARWAGAGAPELLGTLPGGLFSQAYGISRSGLVVVGASDWSSQSGPEHAFRWMNGSMLDLGSLPQPGLVDYAALATSDDGSVIIGNANDMGGDARVFRWTAATGMVAIGGLGPVDDDFAGDVSADGSIVVGFSYGLPFRWTAHTGTVALPLPPGAQFGWAAAITGDGSVIGGYSAGATNRAIFWDAAGVHDLTTVLGPAVPTGWDLQQVTAISDDGLTFAGYSVHNGVREGWIATLPAPGTCYANCDASTTPPILNVNDFVCFLNRFAVGDPYANCDSSTSFPVLTVNDFGCFLNRFAAGCP